MERNHNIDVLKALCAFFVVVIHTPLLGKEFYEPILRCAVPCFFIISGWFIYQEDNNRMMEKIRKSIKRVAILLLWSTALFALVAICRSFINHDFSYLSLKSLLNFVFLNVHPFGRHLWYLAAYLYVLITLLGLCKYKLFKIISFIAPPLLLIGLLIGKYSLLFFDCNPNNIYSRNFLFVGLPYFSIGLLLKKYSKDILSRPHVAEFSVGGIVLFSTLSIVEKNLLVSRGVDAMGDIYLCTTFLAIALFSLFVSTKSIKENRLSRLGRYDSVYIYVFHRLLVEDFFGIVNHHLPQVWSSVYGYAGALIVFVLTVLMCKSLRKLKIIK